MIELPRDIPDVEIFLSLTPEELTAKMLFLVRQRGDAVQFHPGNMLEEVWRDDTRGQSGYPKERNADISLALGEAWAWLQAQGLVIPADGFNGQNGWRRLSRRARAMESGEDFASFKVARLLPREILHPKIADVVWRAFMRGEYDAAVFQAIKAVEIAVREATPALPAGLVGVKLMRAAFGSPGGPLPDATADAGEQVARMELFAGAIGSYKNPHTAM
jgi:uncharacterized protein (TIGR02391 family)